MKVAIVHELLVKLGGAERVAKVFWDMFPDADIYTLLYDEKECGEVFPKEKVYVAPGLQRLYKLGFPRRLMLPWMTTAVENFDLRGYDVVLSSSSAFAHGVLTGTETKHVCYCHSPARYLWDQTFDVQDQQAKRGILGPLKSLFGPGVFHKLRKWDYMSGSRADVLLANARTVQKRTKKFWNQESELVFPPVRTSIFTPQKENEGYFLIVSALSPYKNIDLAVKVFTKLKKHKLVIIGDGAERRRLTEMAGPNVELLGRKSDEVVKQYLQNCRGLLFPGEDDFGIVPVEAMACGKPVLALGKGGATETVVHGKTGILFDEPTVESFEKGLTELFKIEDTFDTKKIAKHAEKFSEEAFKKTIMKYIKG